MGRFLFSVIEISTLLLSAIISYYHNNKSCERNQVYIDKKVEFCYNDCYGKEIIPLLIITKVTIYKTKES